MAHPRMYDDSNPIIKCLREVCLALPEAFEKEAWGECTLRVTGGSMFAMTDNNHHNSDDTTRNKSVGQRLIDRVVAYRTTLARKATPAAAETDSP